MEEKSPKGFFCSAVDKSVHFAPIWGLKKKLERNRKKRLDTEKSEITCQCFNQKHELHFNSN